MEIVKTLKFIDTDNKALATFEKEVKKKKYKVYAVGDSLLFSFGENEKSAERFIEQLELSAFDLDLDFAKVQVVYLNPESGHSFTSQSAIKEFIDKNELEESGSEVPISLVPDLIEYIFENEDNFNSEIVENDFSSEIKKEDNSLVLETGDEEEFIDDLENEPVGIQKQLANERKDEGISETHEELQKTEDSYEEKESIKGGGKIATLEENKPKEQYPENQNDYLLEKAIALFDSHHHIRLPKFDEVTNKELQQEVVDAQFTVSKARDAGIDAIYHRLKAETKNSKQAVETHVIRKAREAHEEVVNTIERNLTVDINSLLSKNDVQYEKDREGYVQSQIPTLRKKYDAEHYADYQSVLSSEIDQLREKSQREIDEENVRFSEYVEKVFKSSDEEIIDNVALEDIIENYNKVAEEQKELLMVHAKGLKGQIGATMSNIMQERDKLKDELHEVESQAEAKKAQEQELIREGVTEGIKEEKDRLTREVQEKLAEASTREQELIKKMDTLNVTINSLEEENKVLQREYVSPSDTGGVETSKVNEPAYQQAVFQKQDKRLSITKLAVGSVLGLALLGVGGLGVSNLIGIKNELAQENYISQERYLAELQADKRYEKVAEKMKEFGYKKDSIASMYLDNGDYISALKEDSGILADFYTYVNKFDTDKQKEMLKNVEKQKAVSDKQMMGVNLRVAVLEKNTENVAKLAKIADKDSAKVAIAYLIKEKDFDDANTLIKMYPDEDLARELKETQDYDTKAKIESTKKEIDTLKSSIETNTKKASSLQDELKKIKDSKDKDKDKKSQDKETEITKNSNEIKELQKKLDEKESLLKELEK